MYYKASYYFNTLIFFEDYKRVETIISGNQLSKHVWTYEFIRHVRICVLAYHVWTCALIRHV